MFDFPANPTVDQTYSAHGVSFRYTGVGWVSTTQPTVTTAGDTPPTSPIDNALWYETDSAILWLRFNDGNSTQWLQISGPPQPASNLFLPLSGGSLSGDLTIAPASGSPTLALSKQSGNNSNAIWGNSGASALPRWLMRLGDNAAESTGNVGSDFNINRFNDAGTYIDTPLSIKRSTGAVTITTDFFAPGPGRFAVVNYDIGASLATRKGYIDGTNGYIGTDGQISAGGTITGYAGLRCFIAQASVASPQASMLFRCPAQPANQRDWELIHGSGGNFTLRAISDDYASSNNVWEITRGSGVAIGRLNINTPTTITGNTFSPANPGAAALLVGGSYGGGIMHNDNNVFAGHWTDSYGAALRFGCGGTASSIAQTFYISTTTTYNISGAWATISDALVKQDVVPYTRGLSAIVELEPVVFTYFQGPFAREVNDPRIGLIAQQVEPHIPEIVGTTEITVDEQPKTVSTLEPGVLIFVVINSLKELLTRLEAVESKLQNV